MSARWRVLTRKYTEQIDEGRCAVVDAAGQLLRAFVDVLLLAGAHNLEGAVALENSMKDKVKDIIVESMKVQKAIGEGVASADFQVICPAANASFTDELMDDVDDCGRGKKGKRILDGTPIMCTTEVGLRRWEKVTRDYGKADQIHAVTLLKAKVALRSDEERKG